MIRRIRKEDVYRIAEIMVFNNRINYYPIFNDPDFSFRQYNVKDLGDGYLQDEKLLNNGYVFEENGIIKGYTLVTKSEIDKLYVDSFFQNQGIGQSLLDFAVKELNGNHLWALEKNEGALRFYRRNGFEEDGQRKLEEGTSEELVHLVLKQK